MKCGPEVALTSQTTGKVVLGFSVENKPEFVFSALQSGATRFYLLS